MKVKELLKKSDKDLRNLLCDEREKVRELRFKISGGQYKDVKEMGRRKKDIARVLTVINGRRLGSVKEYK